MGRACDQAGATRVALAYRAEEARGSTSRDRSRALDSAKPATSRPCSAPPGREWSKTIVRTHLVLLAVHQENATPGTAGSRCDRKVGGRPHPASHTAMQRAQEYEIPPEQSCCGHGGSRGHLEEQVAQRDRRILRSRRTRE